MTRASAPPAPLTYSDGLPLPQRYWAMLAIAIAIAMTVLDAAVANVALPTIAHALHAPAAEAIWVINAYQLAIVVALLPLAAVGDILGYRSVYQAGLVVFTLASLGCALSHTLTELVTARVVQGFGAAGVMSVNGALVRYTYPQKVLGRGVGLNALVVSVSAAVSPTVAAGILALGPWEWLFAVNVPIGIFNVLLAARALPNSELSGRSFDYLSATLNATVFGFLFIGVDTLSHSSGDGAIALGEITVGIAAGGALFLREWRYPRPLIPLDLMRIPIFALSVLTSIGSFAAQSLAYVALPFYFEGALHRDQVQTGLLMTPWPLAVGLSAPIAGRLVERIPAAVLGGVGLVLLALGLGLLAALPVHASVLGIGWRMALCGLGFGMFQSPNNRTLLGSAPRTRAGAAGGMLATARLTGLTSGATLSAFYFRTLPVRAEPVCLATGAVLAALAALASISRLAGSRGFAH